MGISCVNKPLRGEDLEHFNTLQKHFGWSDGLTAAMIGAWQTDQDARDIYPSIEELSKFVNKKARFNKEVKSITRENVGNYVTTTVNSLRDAGLIHRYSLNGGPQRLWVTTDLFQTEIQKQGLSKERKAIIAGKISDLHQALAAYNIPVEAVKVTETQNGAYVEIDSEAVLESMQSFTDKIGKDTNIQTIAEGFKGPEREKIVSILDFLSAKCGITYKVVSQQEARTLLKKGPRTRLDMNAFVQGNTAYFIEGKQLSADIAAEEILHPFVASIKSANPEAFNSLLSDAKKAYPKLAQEIEMSYKEYKDEELVTQALSRAFNEGRRDYPEGHPIKELVRHFIQSIQRLFNPTAWNSEFPSEISSDMLDKNITIDQLARVINSELKIYSDVMSGTRQNKETVDTHQENNPEVPSLTQQMHQTWTPQIIQYRALRVARIFRTVVTELENQLPEIEKRATSAATRKYIIAERYGAGNILTKVRERIASTYANEDWVKNFVHSLYEEEDWSSASCLKDIHDIHEQGNLMLTYFEPLCLEASNEIKRLESVSILTKDGEVIDLSEEEILDDEEAKTKHEEGWFHEAHEQSIEETLDREVTSILSDIYETDSDGDYTRFDDMEQPIPLDFNVVLATTAEVVGKCTIDSQMVPALQKATSKYPWMQQIIDALCGKDNATSKLYQGLSDEDVRLKTLSLQAKFWNGLHKVYVNIAEQIANDEESENNAKGPITSRIVNRKEGEEALYRQFERNCYENKTLFTSDRKPYASVYRADGSFDQKVYDKIHAEIQKSNLYNNMLTGKLSDADFALIDRALKSFGVDINIDNLKKLFDFSQEVSTEQANNIEDLRKVLFGFYAANKGSNEPLKSVMNPAESANIFDAFNENYRILARIFGDDTMGFEESAGRLMVDNENKSLFSRILPNPIHTIINKLKNSDGISEENYQARIQRDYGHNWWFAPKQDASGKGLFRKGVLKDLLEIPATRLGLRVKTLKASQGISYAQEIDAQAEETRLNEFENTRRTVGGVEFRDYSVPAFSDTAESYYMSLRYFNIKDATQRQELISRLAEVVRQEIDRINVVEARAAKGDAVKPIAAFDIKFKDGKRVKDGTDGSYFHFFTSLNKVRDNFLEKYQKLSTNPDEQQRFLNQAIEWALGQEFNFYLSQYNQWQVNALPHSQHTEPREGRAGLIDVIEKNTPTGLPQELSTQLASILNQLRHDTMSQETFNNLKDSALAILSYNNDNEQWKATLKATLDSFTLNTTNLDKLQDYFWNSFYANTQIIQLTMRDPAFLGTTDKFQKRMKMFYSPVATCYTSHYMYDENGNLQLQDSKKADSLTKETEYSLTLKDDEIAQALSYDNVKLAIEKRVVDGYLTSTQAEEILKNLTKINIADAQCYRTLPSWQKCLNMIGQGYNPKMQKAINRLSNPEKYGEWSYDDYNVVWQVFKPFVSSYTTVDSGLEGDQAFNAQFSNIEVPVQHKNAEFLLLAMYSQLSGALKSNWKLKALNEFMVKHGIDKVQFESAVKVSNQAPIDINSCTTPEEITATLEGTTGLNGELQAENGDMQVVHSIPFRDWGISTSMPEHLLEHEESSMGTQLLKIIMEGLAENPNKTLRVGNTEKTYAQWLQLYQAIHTQNLKDAFSEVDEIFSDTRELAAYLKRQILTQNKYSHELIAHLELDENGNFKYPIIDPLLRSQFDALCASLVRNRVTKRPFRLGALPQVASWGFDLQLRFKDKDGNLILTEEEFNKRGEVTINGVTYHSWQEYQDYKKDNCTNLAYMEVLLPPFDNNFMGNINDAFIYKEDVVDGNGRVIHKSGEFNHELFSKKVSKKLLEVLINRVPTETKHSMVPAYVKGFLPSQNSSCIVVPGEWIAISDSDNDGDKCYTYFYKSRVVWDMERIKRAFAESKGFTYQSQSQRAKDMSKNSFKSTDRAKSEALDILYDELMAGRDQASTKELKDFIATSKGNAEFIKTIKPVEFKRESLERLEGETDSQYQQRVDLASIASNSHDARNNFMLELMISVLQTEDNTAQILIPGGFPIVKKVAEEMKKLMRVDDDACSICNPAIRTIHQVRNMAGANLIGVYANHRSFRPLMEQANLTLHPNNRPTINGNKSLPKDKGVPTWSMSALKNGAREFISDNISNFSGCSVDNAKDPKLGFLGQNEVTAPISMMLIHTGYTIREVAAFMNQPAIKECVREYLLSGRKGFLEDIVASHIKTLGEEAKGATEDPSVVAELNMSMLDDQISRNAQGILPDANDNLIQLTVLENFAKILPASRAIQNLITVTKADTQIGALRARSSENKLKLQTMERLAMKVNQSSFPIQGAADLVPELYAESDVTSAKLPQVAAFRYYGIQSIANFMKNISLTFNDLVDEVHEQALDLTDALSLDKDTVDNLTNATASYIFSGIGAFTKMSRAATIRRATAVLNEIKQKGLIQGNALINDLTVNIKGTKYSKRMPFIKLSKNVRKNQRAIENYQRAWEALLANGDTKIQLENGTITYKELSDLLLHYCFLTRGLNVGGNSFIQAFPVSRIADIEGYNELLQRVSSLRGDMETASTILDQYVANHPEDYHFVHRVNTKNFSIQNLLDTAKVVPSMIKIDAFTLKNSEFYSTTTDMYGQKVYNAYPYLYFRDKVGRRYLYKGTTAADGSIIYRRMQVLGNAAYGYLEEYEQGKSVMFGDSNGMTSMLATANSNMVMTSELKNAVDVKVQEAAQKGEVLSQDDIRQTIESMVGSNVQLDIVVDSYETKKEDLTGMEFCVTIS